MSDSEPHICAPSFPFKVIQQMMKNPLTDVGLKRFLDDWEKAKTLLVKEPALA